jgi:ABC-type glycerol-3-phosphate transport system substrate-binding protein
MDAIQARKAVTTLAASNTVETVRASLGAGLGLAMQPGAKGPCPAFAVGKPLIITRTSSDPSAAGKLIEALISPEAQLAHAQTSHDIPSRKSVLADPWFRDPAAADIKVATDYIQTGTRPFKFSKGTSTLQISLALAAQQIVDGRKVKDALGQVAREWDAHQKS